MSTLAKLYLEKRDELSERERKVILDAIEKDNNPLVITGSSNIIGHGTINL